MTSLVTGFYLNRWCFQIALRNQWVAFPISELHWGLKTLCFPLLSASYVLACIIAHWIWTFCTVGWSVCLSDRLIRRWCDMISVGDMPQSRGRAQCITTSERIMRRVSKSRTKPIPALVKLLGRILSPLFPWTAQLNVIYPCLHSYTSGLEISCRVQEESSMD